MGLVVPCDVRGTKETLRIPVRDISLAGIRLVSADPRTPGEVLDLTLRLPTRIDISAEIRWVERNEAKNQYVLGCRFVHDGDTRQALKNTLQSMASAIDSAARRVK